MISEGDKELYEAYAANRMSTDAHVYHGTWPAVIEVYIQRFLAKAVLRDAHIFVTQVSQRPNRDKHELEIGFSKATK